MPSQSPEIYSAAAADRLGFWADQARALHWHKPFTQTLDWSDAPFAQWFADGEINVAYNCLDRHIEAGLGDRVAIQFEGEPGDSRTITYRELTDEVRKAQTLRQPRGGTRRPNCHLYAANPRGRHRDARLRPRWRDSLRGIRRLRRRKPSCRIDDAEAKLVITADGGFRKGAVFNLKDAVDEAVAQTPTVEKVLVVKRAGNDVAWINGRDLWWHDEFPHE